jgi:hypothetical protein
VESVGRRSGGSDGVEIALRHGLSGPPPGRNGGGQGLVVVENGVVYGANDLMGLPTSKGALLKALLCAALYPQVVSVVVPDKGGKGGKGGGKGGGGGGGAPKFQIREQGSVEPVSVALHPSSVNAREVQFESKFLVYAEKVKTSQVYVRDCAPVSPYALLLFGGKLVSGSAKARALIPRGGSDDVTLTVDEWIKFRVPRRIEALIVDVRAQLTALLQQKIAKPALELSEAGRGILNAVSALLGSPPEVSH